jgi:hypothetical protein
MMSDKDPIEDVKEQLKTTNIFLENMDANLANITGIMRVFFVIFTVSMLVIILGGLVVLLTN